MKYEIFGKPTVTFGMETILEKNCDDVWAVSDHCGYIGIEID